VKGAGGLEVVGEQELLDDRLCAGLAALGNERCVYCRTRICRLFMWLLWQCPLFAFLPARAPFLKWWLGDSYYLLNGISNRELGDSQWESVAQRGAELGSQVL